MSQAQAGLNRKALTVLNDFKNVLKEKQIDSNQKVLFCIGNESKVIKHPLLSNLELRVVQRLSHIHLRGVGCVGILSVAELEEKVANAFIISAQLIKDQGLEPYINVGGAEYSLDDFKSHIEN